MVPSQQYRRGAPTGGWPRRIALVGIDGSGKTTQAHRLAAALTRAGVPATYWQNAGGRRWLGRLARRLGRPDGRRLLTRPGLLLTESVLRWLAIARALVRSAPRRRVAVMDRYAVCQYASIRVQGGGWSERLARLAYRVFPRPDVTFLLAVSPAEAYRRIELRGTDHESIDYLSAADRAYRSLPEAAEFVLIDADRPPDEVSRQILAWLSQRSTPQPPEPHPQPAPAPDRAPTAAPAPVPDPRPAAEPGPRLSLESGLDRPVTRDRPGEPVQARP
ncbi:dTMP kinase [Solwaraspora sp. WMMD1047]|uniref:dTMP kinase n=1 Tax=Solwaraspora sp. WMMD1047 TaxID=3016102 RepID=UPI002416F12B|nr:dTMP kinase [Solwaraspora sp. WMMD1047]MDG4828925.1 dTMP kinase [Solwaraspora sp. WMMD1047]